MSRPHKLSLKSIVAASATAPAEHEAEVVRLQPSSDEGSPQRQATLKERARQLSVYLEPAVHDQLRDIAYTERTKIHPLMLEALDLLFMSRGARSIREIEEGARANAP